MVLFTHGMPPYLKVITINFFEIILTVDVWNIKIFQPFFNPSIIKRLVSGNFDCVIIHSTSIRVIGWLF